MAKQRKPEEDISRIDKLLKARLRDAVRTCEPCLASFTDFADEREAEVLRICAASEAGDCKILFWGGYEGAERKMLGIFDPADEPENGAFPIKALRIAYDSRFGALSHRDFLGALMGLGIDRRKFGDILVDEGFATVFCAGKCAAAVAEGLKTVGKCPVSVDFDTSGCYNRKDNREVCSAVIAASRLDAATAAFLHISRGRAEELIADGLVTLDCVVRTDKSRGVFPGDRISVRGFGKFEILTAETGGRKGKLHISYARYK